MLLVCFDTSFIISTYIIFFGIMFHRIHNLFLCGDATQNVHLGRDINSAVDKIKKTLQKTDESLYCVLEDLEYSETKEQVRLSFKKLNGLMRYPLRIFSQRENFSAIRNALQKLGVSEKFRENLIKNSTLRDAIVNYKREVLQLLAIQQRMIENEDARDYKIDKELFDMFFPDFKPALEVEVKENSSGRARKRRKLQHVKYRGIKDFNENKPSNARKIDCIFNKNGNCMKGNKCKFKHSSYK